MKKLLILLSLLLTLQGAVFAAKTNVTTIAPKMSDLKVFSEDGKFGLKDKKDNVIVKADYKKLIRVGETSWIVQKGNKFGLMDSTGNYLVEPKYRNAERIFLKYAKFGNNNDFGLYDEYGKTIIKPEYSSISLLYGRMFLTCKKYKYGIVDFDGNVLLDNVFDSIYMPNVHALRICYEGEWYEIAKFKEQDIELPENVKKVIIDDTEYTITHLVANSGIMSGYSAVTTADYSLKIISSISPAYEKTIDELMYFKGLDGVSAFIKMDWLLKFPFVYSKNYYQTLRNPNNGPLYKIKSSIKRNMK